MKKFFIPLFLVLLFSCSNEDFKPDGRAASEQKHNRCYVEHNHKYYDSISESLCAEMGGEPGRYCPIDVCKPDEEISSSSRNTVSSSSRNTVSSSSRGSSSSVGTGSSSSGDDDSSSSGDDNSSSSVGTTGSSSSVGTVSSSSVGTGGSSSSVGTGGSSSSIGSSSSSVTVSSSSVGISSSSSAPPSLTCSAFPYYVVKAKKESIKNLVSNNGCGNVTYSLTGSGTNGISITGDTISFANATASSQKRTITIRASAPQCVAKECPIDVVILDAAYKDARCNHEDIFPVNLTITSATTVIDYACCEPKTDYIITQCGTANFTLSIDGTVAVTSKDNEVKLPDHTPIPEPNDQCKKYGGSPGGVLYRYPKRMLMTVTNSLPTGGFSCNSW